MSRYCKVETKLKDIESILEALIETGKWTREQIEVHDIPQHLYGYHGDQRIETANIIIPRRHIGKISNDIGFIKKDDGNYEAIISEYDSDKFNNKWINKLKANYAFQCIKKDQEKRGRSVTRDLLSNGRQRVVVTGYR